MAKERSMDLGGMGWAVNITKTPCPNSQRTNLKEKYKVSKAPKEVCFFLTVSLIPCVFKPHMYTNLQSKLPEQDQCRS